MPRNNSYFIAITIPEPINSQIELIKRKIYIEYGTKSVLKSPPHITIVPPFFWGNEEDLLSMVQSFSFPSFKVELSDYDSFPLGVVFIDTVKTATLYELHQTFNALFIRTFPQLKKTPLFPFHPHVTVGNRDWKQEQFIRCWNDYKFETFNASFLFGQLTLLRNTNGLWLPVLSGQ